MLLRNQQSLLTTTFKILWLSCILVCGTIPGTLASEYPALSAAEKAWVGQQIFNNECASRLECLSSWNSSEAFPSMGIGHFIWYSEGQDEIFEESFPELLQYFVSRGIDLPAWIIDTNFTAPWQSRNEFLNELQGARLQELRELLASTMTEQTEFMIDRFDAALNKILAASTQQDQGEIEEKFLAVAHSHAPFGLYALIDYVNFKGEGISSNEQYAGQGWGLLQVLQQMPADEQPLPAFVDAARYILQQRVAHAPANRNEAQWLAGWMKRLDSYLPPLYEQGR
jgi:hypothetical protein